MTENVNYRWVNGIDATAEEWDRIDAIFCARGWMSLGRDTSRILVAEDDNGKMLGFYCLQFVAHVEPLFVIPSQRGSGIADELADRMLEFMVDMKARGWMLAADNPTVARMAESRGMVKVESQMYVAK